jgi:hypothetical protein
MKFFHPNGSILTCSVVGCLRPAEHRVSDFGYYCDMHRPMSIPGDIREHPVGPWQLAGIPTPSRVTRERVPALIDDMDVMLSILIGEAMLS